MCANIMYVKGKAGFKGAIQSKLDNSWLLGTPEADHNLVMFWLIDPSRLREFKMAIGSTIIFKYRLQFISDLGKYIRSENHKRYMEFSLQDAEMNLEMGAWEKDREHGGRMH